jgi:hypothetical protein
MKENFSSINIALGIEGPGIIEVSYDNCTTLNYVPNTIQIENKRKKDELFERVKKRRLQLAIEKYEIKELEVIKENSLEIDYTIKEEDVYKPKPTKPTHIPRHKPKKYKPTRNITRSDVGLTNYNSYDKIKNINFIF